MSQNDIFKSLTRGARFKSENFAKQVPFFTPRPTDAKTHTTVAASAPTPATLSASDKPEKKKKKLRHNLHQRPLSDVAGRDLRRKEKIQVKGQDVPAPIKYFEQLTPVYDVPEHISKLLMSRNYDRPTPIQMQVWPVMLKKRDLIACAPTGSGKTLAFLVPLLTLLKEHSREGLRALVLSPTKELSQQTQREADRFFELFPEEGRLKLLRLSSSAASRPSRLNRCDILISTPKRLLDILKDYGLDLSHVQYLILDEADTLFDRGFHSQLDEVLAATTRPGLVKSVFSATITRNVEQLASSVMNDHVTVMVGKKITANLNVHQRLVFCTTEDHKLLTVKQLFIDGLDLPALVFLQSKKRADDLYSELRALKFGVSLIHADRTQDQREEAIQQFRLGKLACLICTELLARGIDFKGVGTVINFDVPTSSVKYIHRIGRTGRAGRRGTAVTLFTPQDSHYVKMLAPVIRQAGGEVQPWMLKMRREWDEKRQNKRKSAAFNRPGFLASEEREKFVAQVKQRKERVRRLLEKKARRQASRTQRDQEKAERRAARAAKENATASFHESTERSSAKKISKKPKQDQQGTDEAVPKRKLADTDAQKARKRRRKEEATSIA